MPYYGMGEGGVRPRRRRVAKSSLAQKKLSAIRSILRAKRGGGEGGARRRRRHPAMMY